jgi:hypothetical protein
MNSFPEFLLTKGVVTPEDLLRCIDYRRWMLPFIGTLAVNRGFMDAAKVIIVVEECETKRRHFGEVALSKGYLTADQVEELLAEQAEAHQPLADCLSKLRILSRVQVEDLHAEFLDLVADPNAIKAPSH